MNDTEDNRTLFSSLVIVNDLAYTDYTKFRVLRFSQIDHEADPFRSTFLQETPAMIASVQGRDDSFWMMSETKRVSPLIMLAMLC